MYFNSSRAHQFAFDRVAWEYDGARPRFDLDLVAAMADIADLHPEDAVYEVGAGTGQLTEALLSFGFTVTANEPGENMRAQLEQFAGDRLTITEPLFEDDPVAPHSQAAVFAANSFHWIRPEVAFPKVRHIVRSGGSLGLIWNFAFLEPHVQAKLNSSAFTGHDDLIQDPALEIDAFEGVMALGRDLIRSSEMFAEPWWEWSSAQRDVSPSDYADLCVSFASTAARSDDARLALQERIGNDLAELGVDEVTITDHIYACVARTRPH